MKVREAIKLVEEDGWILVRTRGSHRQYKHSVKKGLVTIPGKMNSNLAIGTKNSIREASRIREMKYLIVLEKTETGYSVYSPDLYYSHMILSLKKVG